MSSVSPTNQDLSNDTTFSQIKSRVPVPLKRFRYIYIYQSIALFNDFYRPLYNFKFTEGTLYDELKTGQC